MRLRKRGVNGRREWYIAEASGKHHGSWEQEVVTCRRMWDPKVMVGVIRRSCPTSGKYCCATFAEDTPAAMFMVEQVRKYPGEITIYSGGALTNIALAVRMDPTFAQNTKGLFIMGGYVDRMVQQTTGDVFQASLVSDINFVVDPEAAKIALSAAFPKITLVGNAANLLISTQDFLDEIYEVKNPYSELVHAYYGTGLPFWDETAAAVMVDPSIVTDSVECESSRALWQRPS
jgi:inosine-uridine nucleoside N-ribohydrolase